jgi:hypothetical protein
MTPKWKSKTDKDKKQMKYPKLEALQTRKLISAYGGVGSIVETRDGAILISPFDEWAFFKKRLHEVPTNHVDDPRFLNRLKKWFERLEALVCIPANDYDDNHLPTNWDETASATYFPKWMFCPQCKRFDHFDNWLRRWEDKYKNAKNKEKFLPPACCECSKERRHVHLEQIRFILTSPSGGICDVPWERWVFAKIEPKRGQQESSGEEMVSEGEEQNCRLDFDAPISQDVYYEYWTSDKFTNLTGINIVAKSIDTHKEVKNQTLSGVFNLRVEEDKILPEESFAHSKMKVAVRSSNSVYYPNILQSLWLPSTFKPVTEAVVSEIKKYVFEKNFTPEIIEQILDAREIKVSREFIERLVENNFEMSSDVPIEENEYRRGEYQFIASQTTRFEEEDERLIFEPVKPSFVNVPGVRCIYRMDKLKLTAVQASYTRQEPMDKDYFLIPDSGDVRTREGQRLWKRYTSKYGKLTKYLPAVENYGEGIFIDFDKVTIDSWLNGSCGSVIEERAAYIQENYLRNRMNPLEKKVVSAKLLLLHTFSHLIIKELEFSCGYPATSLQERLYVGDDMQGVLIYVMAGAEGSYGGLVSLCKSEKIGKLIKAALLRATDCASDPICWHTDRQGQGVGGANLAACFSCAMLPETSCEEFNRFLDRRLVVDGEFGFFK